MRIRYHNAIAALALLAASAAPALATPNINGASIHPRVFNDCPGSIFNVNNGSRFVTYAIEVSPASRAWLAPSRWYGCLPVISS